MAEANLNSEMEEPNPDLDENTNSERHYSYNIDRLKMTKSRAKAAFTRHKNVINQYLEEPDMASITAAIKATNSKLDSALDTAMNSKHDLSDYYTYMDDKVGLHQVALEMEQLEKEYSETVNLVQEFFQENREVNVLAFQKVIRHWHLNMSQNRAMNYRHPKLVRLLKSRLLKNRHLKQS